MKKNILSILALILALVSLGLSLVCYLAVQEEPTYYSDRLFELNRENEELRTQIGTLNTQIEELHTRLDQLQTVVSLSGWTLETVPWDSSTGADITFTATPTEYMEGVSANLLVLLEGQQIANIPCGWDGTAFTATAGLDAADGYSYYCVLTSPGGTQQLPLTSPEDPVQDIPVYLASSLSAYCTLTVDSWEETEDSLILTIAHTQAQLPRLSAEGEAAIDTAQLVFSHNGSEITRLPITLNPSEVAGSFDLTITDAELPLPEMDEDDLLELRLDVILTDGRELTAYGASWYRSGNNLFAVMG